MENVVGINDFVMFGFHVATKLFFFKLPFFHQVSPLTSVFDNLQIRLIWVVILASIFIDDNFIHWWTCTLIDKSVRKSFCLSELCINRYTFMQKRWINIFYVLIHVSINKKENYFCLWWAILARTLLLSFSGRVTKLAELS